MSRTLFTQKSAEDLKTTLTSTVLLLNQLFWREWMSYIFSEGYGLANDKELIVLTEDVASTHQPIKPYKPSKMAVYNACSKILGYNSWNELLKVSENNTKVDTIFVCEDSALVEQFTSFFTQSLYDQIPVSKSSSVRSYYETCVKDVVCYVVNGLILNPNENVDNSDFAPYLGLKGTSPDIDPTKLMKLVYCAHTATECIATDFESGLPKLIPVPNWFLYFHYEGTMEYRWDYRWDSRASSSLAGLAGSIKLYDWVNSFSYYFYSYEGGYSGYTPFRDFIFEPKRKADILKYLLSNWAMCTGRSPDE
ncbi:hypothetical protein VCHA53O466_40447 [Vibrio chagasii]|nr:hypothetical protein VCHA53O466_40447 [Vibrio chagasii]